MGYASLKGRELLLKLVAGQAGTIEAFRRARLQISAPYTGQSGCLLSWEVQYIINRDKLKRATPRFEEVDLRWIIKHST